MLPAYKKSNIPSIKTNSYMLTNRQLQIAFFCLSVVFMASCQPGVVYHEHGSLPAEGWHYRDGILFEAEIEDTVSLHQLFIDVRNTTEYEYSNLFLFLDIEFPGNRTIRDTLECVLADRRGQWTGKGSGRIRSNRFLFRDDVWFPESGTYRFTVYQGMRHDTLKGLSDVGIRIEKK